MAYLIDNAPARSQFRRPRRARPTGLIVVHTAESVMDTIGPDTGAEGVARFIRNRDTPGSYHDIVDSDSVINLVPYDAEAFQDGTGSNGYALSISFALSAAMWPDLTSDRRDAYLRQGVVAFRRQQDWLRRSGYPLTGLRRLTRAQSDGGASGFISHGERDPARRSDPGAGFPWSRFIEMCTGTDTTEDDMPLTPSDYPAISPGIRADVQEMVVDVLRNEGVSGAADGVRQLLAQVAGIPDAVRAAVAELPEGKVDTDALAASIVLRLGQAAGGGA